MQELISSDVPAFGKLIEAIRELTEAGNLKWENPWDADCATLRFNITGQMRSPVHKRGAVAIWVGGYPSAGANSVCIVAGDEAEKLNAVLRSYPVDAEEFDDMASIAKP
jgi:hypothetical protein